ncbi:helix-turn-helix transcriptional regulator [Tamlana sp. 2_MG-2023]|uniref:helix-turn-helix transcriptional regulator n=1 Tax=unclassified Tamlana TaxID=2614803 RepID=UPI0026E3EA74|nr:MULTISPECIES: helix-turn-helix transcriptional regulator [unclassified Tamlana]MDO6761895.1 helix-turn-helix transcriptional regulator [Tamlana sp. 2_MG-2023]MDO6792654.1 helix-turn-helix transcriptional regulator [Tamlana sp. 1_MG-2023]
MRSYNEFELHILNIQIGCVLKLARLKKGLSQHQLSLILESNPTSIGRIERFEHSCSWDKLYQFCQNLDLDFCNLFILKQREELLAIVDETIKHEEKLTQRKRAYYKSLKVLIKQEFKI